MRPKAHPKASEETEKKEWRVGDRVIVHSLTKAFHLNGRHGCVVGTADHATGRFPIDFDFQQRHQDTRTDISSSPVSHRVMVKTENLKHESKAKGKATKDLAQPNSKTNGGACGRSLQNHVAAVANGVLIDEEGRSLCLILDAIRFIVGNIIHHDPQLQTGLVDIERLRQQGQTGLETIHRYMQSAWMYWDHHRLSSDSQQYHQQEDRHGSSDKHRAPSVYLLLIQFFQDLSAVNNVSPSDMPLEFHRAQSALYHKTAVKGWNTTRIHGDFWVVGTDHDLYYDYESEQRDEEKDEDSASQDDDGGTYLVSHSHLNNNNNQQQQSVIVYKVFGLRNSLSEALAIQHDDEEEQEEEEDIMTRRPVLLNVTLLPWYGRLVYDGIGVPAHGKQGLPEIANEALAQELHRMVSLAKHEKRVVEQILPQLWRFDAPSNETRDEADSDLQQPQPSYGEKFWQQSSPLHQQPNPSTEEMELLYKLEDMPLATIEEGIWCMRRVGYTEEDNPMHEGIIINGAALSGGITIGSFTCADLVPTAEDILKALVNQNREVKGEGITKLPAIVLIDDYGCYERVQYLLQEHTPQGFALRAMYYPPPTPEETAAALLERK
jgi:hypothetical protein